MRKEPYEFPLEDYLSREEFNRIKKNSHGIKKHRF